MKVDINRLPARAVPATNDLRISFLLVKRQSLIVEPSGGEIVASAGLIGSGENEKRTDCRSIVASSRGLRGRRQRCQLGADDEAVVFGRDLCTDGASEVSPTMQSRLHQHDIAVCAERIAKLEGTEDGALQRIHLQDGRILKRTAMFFTTGCHQTSDLSAALGCARDKKGGIITDPVTEESSVRGVYVAGDASRDVLLVAVAIAEGAKAGVAINRALLQEDGLG